MQQDLNLSKLNKIIRQNLQSLNISFEKYFPSEKTTCERNVWIATPFITYGSPYDSLLENSADIMLKPSVSTMSIDKFWIKLNNEYLSLHEKAMKVLVPFATTYLCESGFSFMTVIRHYFYNF